MVKIILTILLLATLNFAQTPCGTEAKSRTKAKASSTKADINPANTSASWMSTRGLNDLVVTETDHQLFVSGEELGLQDPNRECYGLIWRYRGGTWEPQKLDFLCSVEHMQWESPQKGWVQGHYFYRTEDGGRSWQRINKGDQEVRATTFFFLNDKTAWYFGFDGFLKFMNGNSYTNLAEVDVLRERKIKFVSPTIGWLHVHTNEGKPELLHTNDGGKTWNTFDDLAEKEVWDFQLDNAEQGYAIVDNSVFRTRDGGVSWEDLGLRKGKGLQRVFFLDAVRGWVTGRNSCRTSDGGLTWNCWDLPDDMFTNSEQLRLIFLNTMQGWLLTNRGLYATKNGGKSWRREYLTYNGECF